jgi:uncharacterized protein (TIGR02594 family)
MNFFKAIAEFFANLFNSKKTEVKHEPESLIPWYDIAEKELGQTELVGIKHNPRILEYHSVTSYKGKTDEISWVLLKAGYKSLKTAWARDYEHYGPKLAKPVKGCIMLFERNGKGGDSHVTFYTGIETATEYKVLGGNQSNQVCIKGYLKNDLIGAYWPKKG